MATEKPTNPRRLYAYVVSLPYRKIEVSTVPDALEQDVRDGVSATVSEYVRADVAALSMSGEVIRLRAALESIAALQTEEPEGDHTDDNLDYACEVGIERGLYTASQIARAALDGGK